jgi:hypothetical protein
MAAPASSWKNDVAASFLLWPCQSAVLQHGLLSAANRPSLSAVGGQRYRQLAHFRRIIGEQDSSGFRAQLGQRYVD